MKKILILLFSLFTLSGVAHADNDRPVSASALPAQAQTFIKHHFSHSDIAKVWQDDDGFDVRMRNGIEIEFGRNGKWTEIKRNRKGLPASVIPKRILHHVVESYGSKVRVVEISRGYDDIEIKLSNGKELEFDRQTADFIREDD